MNSIHNRESEEIGQWIPVAFELRVKKSTYLRVEIIKSRWERPWRWSVVNRSSAGMNRILSYGEKETQELAMEAALEEWSKKTQGERLGAEMKLMNQKEKDQ